MDRAGLVAERVATSSYTGTGEGVPYYFQKYTGRHKDSLMPKEYNGYATSSFIVILYTGRSGKTRF